MFSVTEMTVVDRLLVPGMGTETIAPLMHFLVRFTRARSILEGGAGYTTPFLAKALSDNQRDFYAEKERIQRKSSDYIHEVAVTVASDPASTIVGRPAGFRPVGLRPLTTRKLSALARKRFEWLCQDPPWAEPNYYLRPYTPRLYCVDDFSNAKSSAPLVADALDRLGLSEHVSFQNVGFWDFDPRLLPADDLPLDLIWIDLPVGTKHLADLLEGEYWKALNPNGGLLIIHDMLTTRGGQLLVREFKRMQRNSRFDDFELVGVLQPQRLMQGDFLLLRKTSGIVMDPVDDAIQAPGKDLLEDAAEALLSEPRG